MSSIMYLLYFGKEDAGYAATIGILMFAMISVAGIFTLILLRRREVAA
jgi:raffinose/stachyose/melibiose transport system permease protein